MTKGHGQILMVSYMNREALDRTLATYYSRSRQKLWKKGEESGHGQQVRGVLVDCDQDCLILMVSVDAANATSAANPASTAPSSPYQKRT